MAMPWSRAKAKAAAIRADHTGAELARLTALFDACFRLQREACAAAGRHIPMVVENVKGAQPWVGRARWSFGSFYLWGDVPALMPHVVKHERKVAMASWRHPDDPRHVPGQGFNTIADRATKNAGGSWFAIAHNTTSGKGRNPDGRKQPGGGAEGWFGSNDGPRRKHHSKHPARKFPSAMIAKIPLPLSRHVAAVYAPKG
jgi:hypothetical protein